MYGKYFAYIPRKSLKIGFSTIRPCGLAELLCKPNLVPKFLVLQNPLRMQRAHVCYVLCHLCISDIKNRNYLDCEFFCPNLEVIPAAMKPCYPPKAFLQPLFKNVCKKIALISILPVVELRKYVNIKCFEVCAFCPRAAQNRFALLAIPVYFFQYILYNTLNFFLVLCAWADIRNNFLQQFHAVPAVIIL